MFRSLMAVVVLVLLPVAGAAQQTSSTVLIKAGRLIDGISHTPRTGVGILVVGDRIQAVGPLAQVTAQAGPIFVTDVSPHRHGNSVPGIVTLIGAGFDATTTVEFLGPGARGIDDYRRDYCQFWSAFTTL